MSKRNLIASLITAVSLVAGMGLAAAQKSSDDCAVQRKKNPKAVCKLAIDREVIEKDGVTPGGFTVVGRADSKHPTLIRYRENFDDRIVASAESR